MGVKGKGDKRRLGRGGKSKERGLHGHSGRRRGERKGGL